MRQTPIHDWHREHGAVFAHAGDWYRPEYYACGDASRDECIVQEARQVRAGLGIIDVSTLGKLQVSGPDASELLERLYTGRFKKLPIGRCRYGVALDESGVVVEDGVIARLSEDRFYATTTSSGSAAFYREMLRWAAIWGLDATLSNATGQLAAFNLAGPGSRDALAALTDIDLRSGPFSYLRVREGEVAGGTGTGDASGLCRRTGIRGPRAGLGRRARVASAIGGRCASLWSGGAAPVALGKRALDRRHDTDALTYPQEAGLAWAIGKNKRFFIGQRSLQIHAVRPARRTLVGVRWPANFAGKLPEECNLIMREGWIAGRVTSIAPVSTLGYPLGLAFVEADMAEPGTRVEVRLDDGSTSVAAVTALPFYDPEDERQKL